MSSLLRQYGELGIGLKYNAPMGEKMNINHCMACMEVGQRGRTNHCS